MNIRYGMTGADYFIIPDDINEVGNWFHIVIVRNESIGKLIYYLNGSVLDQIDYPAGAYTNTGLPILIGESNCLPDINANFNGFIDDIGIWERPLSNLEVNQLYLSCDLEITESPIDLESSVGADVQFTCASNDPEGTFQWESDMGFGFVLLSDAGKYFGVNNDTLIVTSVTMANNNQKFRCVIYSMTCNDTTEAALLSVVTGTSANNIITEDYFSLYPNPVYNGQLTIRGDLGAQFDAVLIDNYGAMVRAFNGLSGNTVLNLENIQPGMYIIRFQSSGINITKSIIIAQ
ncbi:MAG: T9SS type A sorting domain-containing protein [Bacteroidetes bacterium]|nr:T9SS type A sorting domain-containing protein [Bacteroidota bacterium]